MEKSRIIVLLSSYNGEKYIAEQLDSILSQQNVDVKILCRDDGSSDKTKEIISQYVESHPNKIELITGNNLGFALSFTELIKIAEERFHDVEYFAFADQDDVWLPEKLSSGIEFLKTERKDIPVAYCSNLSLVNSNLEFMKYGKSPYYNLTKGKALVQNVATGCTVIMNRKTVELYNRHTPKIIFYHDFLVFQICMFLGKMIYDSSSHILYRQHSSNQIGAPGKIARMKHRFSGHFSKHVLQQQNIAFYDAYKELLSENDRNLFIRFNSYNMSIFSKIRLIFDKDIKYDSFEPNFFMILKIISGTL